MRVLQVLGALAGLAILASNLADAARELRGQHVPVSWPLAGLATVLLALTYAGLAWLWSAIARELGVVVRFRTALQFWSISNLGRYVPGKIWQITGVMLVAKDLGVPPGLAAAIGVLSLLLMVATGALLGFGLLPSVFASDALRLGAAALSALALALPVLRPAILREAMDRIPRAIPRGEIAEPTRAGVLRLVAAFVLVWVVHGAVFHVLCAAFAPVSPEDVLPLTGAFCIAYVSGLLALIAPGGIGVREEVLGATLAAVIPGGPVHVIAIAARVWTMVAELAVLGVALAFRLRDGRERRPS
jgi:hypothetical protein